MAGRDRVVLWVLGVAVLLTALSWWLLGPWPALVVVLAAVGGACVAYRIEPSRIDVEHPEAWTTESPTDPTPRDPITRKRLDAR